MSYRSLLLLASAGIAVARTITSSCDDNLAAVTGLLQADDGKAYCSSVLDIGTVTDTVVESTTTQETTTITTPSEAALLTTTTETEIISSGTVTETLPLFMTTTTLAVTTTAYACPAPVFRRDLRGNLAAYNEAKATSSPVPTQSADEWEYDEDCEDEDEELEGSPAAYGAHSMGSSDAYSASAPAGHLASPPAAYGIHSMDPSAAHQASAPSGYNASPAPYDAHSMAFSAIYPASAPTGYAASPSTYGPMSSYIAQSTIPNHVKYPQASGNASIYYPSGTVSSSHSLSTALSDWHPQVSANSTLPLPTGALSSSLSLSTVSIESTISTMSTESTTPTVTLAPTPEPSCDTAPTALRSGYSCDTLSAVCGCLDLPSATEDLTITTTFTEVIYTTEVMVITRITELTETLSLTVPATTLTLSPTSTITETALTTATACPCSAPTSSLCGTTPDTCRGLQTDAANCGSCGNTCASGSTCAAGTCVAPAIPDVPSCATSTCGKYTLCGANDSCLCIATPEGSGVCASGSTSCYNPKCTKSSDCGPDEKCGINSCCSRGVPGAGICIKVQNKCPNMGASTQVFRRRAWGGETVGGGEF
jgi:hypothetical protein